MVVFWVAMLVCLSLPKCCFRCQKKLFGISGADNYRGGMISGEGGKLHQSIPKVGGYLVFELLKSIFVHICATWLY